MQVVEATKLAVRVCLVSVVVFGVVAVTPTLLSGVSGTLGLRMRSTWWRLPLGVNDLVVDKNGRIYTWNDSGRIQVYDSHGRFLNGWSFGANGAWLLLGQDGESIIVVRHYRSSVSFDQKGRQLDEKRDNPGRYDEIAHQRFTNGAWTPSFEDAGGNVYRQEGWFLHSIVRVNPRGQKTVIVRDPVYVGMFNYVLGILLMFFSIVGWKIGSVIAGSCSASRRKPGNRDAKLGGNPASRDSKTRGRKGDKSNY